MCSCQLWQVLPGALRLRGSGGRQLAVRAAAQARRQDGQLLPERDAQVLVPPLRRGQLCEQGGLRVHHRRPPHTHANRSGYTHLAFCAVCFRSLTTSVPTETYVTPKCPVPPARLFTTEPSLELVPVHSVRSGISQLQQFQVTYQQPTVAYRPPIATHSTLFWKFPRKGQFYWL